MMQRCGVESWKNTPRGGKNNEEELSAIRGGLSAISSQLSVSYENDCVDLIK